MPKSSFVAALALSLLAAACHSGPSGNAPPSTPTDDVARSTVHGDVDSSPLGLLDLKAPPSLFPMGNERRDALQITGAFAPLTTACSVGKSTGGFYGFYRTDAWNKGDVVLTFDDGPHPKHTPRVLDLLAEHHMPATFFVVGRAINRDTYHLVRRVVGEGHTLGSHSYSHDVKMTKVNAPENTVQTIRGQHEVTAILIDVSLMAESGDDFDAMFEQVFDSDPATWLSGRAIREGWSTFVKRHRELLASRGFEDGARPYTVLYSRPPGGGPYVEHDGKAGIALYDAALEQLSMMNVMWHGASGDTVPEKRSDFRFLTDNLARHSKSGGVLLVHDYIRADALAHGLRAMAKDESIQVVPIGHAVERKYGCDDRAFAAKLRGVDTAGQPESPSLAAARNRLKAEERTGG